MKTVSIKPSDIKKEWLIVDAANKPVGRIAAEVSRLLRGKHKPSFVSHLDCGDNVIIVNAEKVKLSLAKSGTINFTTVTRTTLVVLSRLQLAKCWITTLKES